MKRKVIKDTKGEIFHSEDLLRIKTYAERMGVAKNAVHYRIRQGEIIPVDLDGFSYISWSRYRNLNFRQPNREENE